MGIYQPYKKNTGHKRIEGGYDELVVSMSQDAVERIGASSQYGWCCSAIVDDSARTVTAPVCCDEW